MLGALQSKQILQKKLDRAHPTLPPLHNLFWKPVTGMGRILKSQQLTTSNNVYKQNTRGIPPQNISTSTGLFWETKMVAVAS